MDRNASRLLDLVAGSGGVRSVAERVCASEHHEFHAEGASRRSLARKGRGEQAPPLDPEHAIRLDPAAQAEQLGGIEERLDTVILARADH